ncbi:mandelate racemase/muconate lactonizing enzyme family protein [candidate division KSB1 bacterium]|nr:mandelate racemase/muconate lactonizing enzyme family protein [candidate division KSB1 bacterium]RQW01315.1 MAG: mandelate racemase/muconate lactonizing enzyme family protein [candidate division KSB1 bacterium]
MNRRNWFKSAGAAVAAGSMGSLLSSRDLAAIENNVKRASEPSKLEITDLRVVRIGATWRKYVIRLDTNQGISGYGEVRDGASPTYALFLKSRILGENPCNVDKIFRKIKQFGGHARQAGGVVSIEMACWDLAGKAWGVPCWQMLGGKFRDKIRMYADTPTSKDPVEMGNRLKKRVERGFTFLKMDIGIGLLRDVEGALTYPSGMTDTSQIMHPFTGIRITDKGLKIFKDYAATVREIVGWETPIALDHFGHFPVEDCIKIAQALDPYNFAWYEDMIPWQLTDQYVMLRQSCNTPILTGEDIYLKEGFMELFEKKAIAICHPDPASAGGLLETKKIGDLAMEHGISMALHMAGSPITLFATIHAAAATENFLVCEHHNVDDEWYDDLVDGVEKPLFNNGYVTVPAGPGLGIELNEEEVKRHLREGEHYFAPTDEWNEERSWDRLWSRRAGKRQVGVG